jgi:hypothetical protein
MGLLSFLSSLVNGDDEGGGSPTKFGYDDEGYLVPQAPQGAQAPGTMAPQALAPQPPAPHSADDVIAVTGDSWKPKKDTILGALADAISYYTDGTTPFKDERDKQNMISASKGLMNHPEEAIGRIAQIDPTAAWKYRSQVVDDTRQQKNLERQNRVYDGTNENIVYNRVAGMMNAATPETWKAMREQAIKVGQLRGVDVSSLIPEDYDENAARYIAYGAVPPAKQMQMNETSRYHDATTDYRNRNLQERSTYHQGQLGLDAQRNNIAAGNLSERSEHNDVTEQQGQERIDKTPAKPQQRAYDTKYGRGLVSPDGMQMNIIPDPRVDQSKLHNTKNGPRLIYDNLGTANKPIWRLRKP